MKQCCKAPIQRTELVTAAGNPEVPRWMTLSESGMQEPEEAKRFPLLCCLLKLGVKGTEAKLRGGRGLVGEEGVAPKRGRRDPNGLRRPKVLKRGPKRCLRSAVGDVPYNQFRRVLGAGDKSDARIHLERLINVPPLRVLKAA